MADHLGGCMFGLVVHFELRAGLADAFDALVAETLESIRVSEPGTLIYAVHRSADAEHLRVFYELYRDRDAFDEHERQGHTARFLAEREQFLAAPPRVEFVTLLSGVGVAGGS
ncbi:MAG: putative quinol monooxygenase [Frankiaceae bacterium]